MWGGYVGVWVWCVGIGGNFEKVCYCNVLVGVIVVMCWYVWGWIRRLWWVCVLYVGL